MAKPVILAVDDDGPVLDAVQRDLRRRYGRDFRVVGASSADQALEILDELESRKEPVALFVVDQRMPGTTGVELLEKVLPRFPDAKRVLLTAYADTEAAIRAINVVRLDHYILKPWEPPEERLFPITDELLEEWLAGFRPAFQGIRVVGDRWSRDTYRIKEFLARNLMPYQAVDVDVAPEEAERLLAAAGLDATQLPAVLFPDGDPLVRPDITHLAERLGMSTSATSPTYDLVIVGAGPAGLAAAVYGASEGLTTLLLEAEGPGGQAGQSSRIENYLGFPSGLSGAELTRRALAQAKRLGAEVLTPRAATGLERRDPFRIVVLDDGTRLTAKAVLITTGVSYRMLEIPGSEELLGAGIYYGTSRVEALTHADEDVFVVGGGNSAGQAALYLAGFARHVTILIRRPDLTDTMSRYLIDRIDASEQISVRPHSRVAGAEGDGHLERLVIEDVESGEQEAVAAGALFVFIGQRPRTEWLDGLVLTDEKGFILSGVDMNAPPSGWPLERRPLPLETSLPGVFVAGDVRSGSVKRVASAVGEGGIAVRFIHQHLSSL